MNSSCIDKLREEVDKNPYLVHAKNLITRFERKDHLEILEKVVKAYWQYYEANEIIGMEDDVLKKRVAALNSYYNYLYDNGYDGNNIYSAQTKFRPTILEEFMALLFRDFVNEMRIKVDTAQLNLGAVKAYANLFFFGKDFESFARSPAIGVNVKDQDFAIYRNVEWKMDGNTPVCASLPIVAVECKTFIDKTMLEGSVATAEKLKAGNPYAYFCIATELYDVSMEVDPAYSRIDEIYVLRKTTRRAERQEICPDVIIRFVGDFSDKEDTYSGVPFIAIIRFVNDVKRHLMRPWSDVASKLSSTGTLIK